MLAHHQSERSRNNHHQQQLRNPSTTIVLVRAVVLRNEDCLGLFCDQTAILLSEEGRTFYYYSEGLSEGLDKDLDVILEKKPPKFEFQITSFAQNKGKEQIKTKLNQLLLFYNCHVEEPYLSEEILIKEYFASKLFESSVNMSIVQWRFDSELVSFHKDGSVTLRSFTYPDFVSITVAPNGVLFKISFPAKVHSRNTHRSKLLYINQDQLFSKHCFPDRWKDAVSIALYYFKQRNYKDDKPVNGELIYTMNLPPTKTTSRVAGDFKKSGGAGVNTTTLATVYKSIASHRENQSCIGYLSCCLEKNNTILIEYTPLMTLKYLKQVVELIWNEEELYFLSDIFSFFKFWSYDPSYSRPFSKVFDVNILPQEIYSFSENRKGVEITKSLPCKEIFQIMKYLFENSQKMTVSKVPPVVQSNYGIQSQLKKNFSSQILKERHFKSIGLFQLFADGRVRGKFDDRTIVDMTTDEKQGCFQFSILTPAADVFHFSVDRENKPPVHFRNYVNVVIDFRTEAMKTTDQLNQERQESLELQQLVKDCYESNRLILQLSKFKEMQNH